jgi:SSS family solute:Na+ symporter
VPPGIKNPNAVLGIMVAKLTNPLLTGLLTVGILAAIMSSLDSQFLCIGSMFTHDIVVHHFGEGRFSDRQRILLGRSFVVAIVVTAYVLSLVAKRESVFDLGVWCFSGFASLFPVVFASLYWRRVTKAGAIASVVTAAVIWAFLFFWLPTTGGGKGEHLFLGMMPVATIFAASAVALVVVSLVTRPPSREVLERYFGPAQARDAETVAAS